MMPTEEPFIRHKHKAGFDQKQRAFPSITLLLCHEKDDSPPGFHFPACLP
jgi:hypothetical protein